NATSPATTNASVTFNNDGNLNGGVSFSGAGAYIFREAPSHQVNGLVSVAGSGSAMITNGGAFNSGVSFTGSGTNRIDNLTGASINQDINSTGTSADTIDNLGTINGSIRLGAGADLVINRIGGEVSPLLRDLIQGGTDLAARD